MEDTAVDVIVIDRARHTTVLLCGELDRLSSAAVHLRLLDVVDATRRPLVLDLSEVTFFDAAGMRAISAVARYCGERGGGLALVGVRPFTAKMFRLLRMHEYIPLCATVREALWCLLPPTDDEIAGWLGS